MRTAAVAFVLLALCTQATPAALPAAVGQQAFIQVNGHYILYTYPSGARLSPRGALLVPLPIALQLLGAEAYVSPDGSSATVRFLGALFTFTAGSSTGRLNYRPLPLPAPPQRTPQGALLVPLRPILRAGGVPYQWDPTWRVLRIWDERLTSKANPFADFLTFLAPSFDPRSTPRSRFTAFAPLRVHVSWWVGPVPQLPRIRTFWYGVYTELQHTRGLTPVRGEHRFFYWKASFLYVRKGERVLDVWARGRGTLPDPYGGPYRGQEVAYWGDNVPPSGGLDPDTCDARPRGRYVCFLASPTLRQWKPGWQQVVTIVTGTFVEQ